jgi:serine phosphatase RsbU (regulator of sigma subunit)
MTDARAGPPPLLVRYGDNGGKPKALSPRGLALGLADGETFSRLLEEVQIALHPGDSFLMYTDGLIEAMDPERRVYGTQRLQALLTREKGSRPDVLVRHILDDVRIFTQDQPYHDDLTMLVLEVNS